MAQFKSMYCSCRGQKFGPEPLTPLLASMGTEL